MIVVVIASWAEAKSVIDHLRLHKDTSFVLKDRHQQTNGLYINNDNTVSVLVTGVLEHNMVSAVSLLLLKRPNTFSFIVNFGCCGYYNNKNTKIQLGEPYFVSKSKRFDVDDNVHWTPEISLKIPKFANTAQTATCVSGSRYSRPEDYLSDYFPSDAEIEEMELYGLASLCNTLEMPLCAIKYPVNEVCMDGRDQLRKNIVVEQKKAADLLYFLLDGQDF